MVDYLKRNRALDHDAIAYIYFDYKEQAEQTSVSLVTSLLQQLILKDAFIPDEISALFHQHMQHLTRPSAEEWSMLLEMQIRRFSRVFILVDALDECFEKTRDEFLAELQRLRPFVNLLITSRPTLSIEFEFPGVERLDIQAADLDIRRYLNSRLKTERRLKRLLASDTVLGKTIVEKIVENSKGM